MAFFLEFGKTKNEDGKMCGIYDLTYLMGNDIKTLLKHLPNKLQGILQPNCEEKVRFYGDSSQISMKLTPEEMVKRENRFICPYCGVISKTITL